MDAARDRTLSSLQSVPDILRFARPLCAWAVLERHSNLQWRAAGRASYNLRIVHNRSSWKPTARAGSLIVATESLLLWMNVGGTVNAPDMNFLLASTRLCDIVGGLHSHEHIHLHAESVLDAEGHFAR
jgi:hypothetical protein